MGNREPTVGRRIKVDGMSYAPTNEQGVVFLFGRLAARLGFDVECVQNRFPDCIARRNGRRVRIEFEYRASAYAAHPPRGADLIVCWENDWADRPRRFRHLEILDLKPYVGALPRVWVVGCDESKSGHWLERAKTSWNLPKSAEVGDLIVMYRTAPSSKIRDLWEVRGPFYKSREWGWEAWMRCLVRLKNAVTFEKLKNDPRTRNLGVVRRRFQGKADITDDWPRILALILEHNPGAKKALGYFALD